MKVTVIGAGAWGTTVASLVAGSADTTIWAREPEVVAAVNEAHENPVFLPGVELHPQLHASNTLGEALGGVDVVIMGVPSQFFRSVLEGCAGWIDDELPVLSLVKGIEQETLKRMTEVVVEVLARPGDRVGVLTGPNLAREVAVGQPTATVVAMPDQEWAVKLQSLIMGPTLRVYTNDDVVGCEISGAVKNVLAIAAGMARGLGYGENTRAALITRGLAELTRLGVALGGNPLTFIGLAGTGDLIVTCGSPKSRNSHVGIELGKGRALDEIQAEMNAVAEGVKTCPAVLETARRAGVEMPIAEQVHAVLYEGQRPADVVSALMGRQAKAEMHDLG